MIGLTQWQLHLPKLSLNPCFCGRWNDSTLDEYTRLGLTLVLILVFVEDGMIVLDKWLDNAL